MFSRLSRITAAGNPPLEMFGTDPSVGSDLANTANTMLQARLNVELPVMEAIQVLYQCIRAQVVMIGLTRITDDPLRTKVRNIMRARMQTAVVWLEG